MCMFTFPNIIIIEHAWCPNPPPPPAIYGTISMKQCTAHLHHVTKLPELLCSIIMKECLVCKSYM